jgi:hypothetical protein
MMKTPFTGKVRKENQEEWRGGVRVGKWVDYRKDGTVNSERSGVFKNGKKVSD